MDDLRDPERRSASPAPRPEAYLRRREFLQRTALTAGLAAAWRRCSRPTCSWPRRLSASAARRCPPRAISPIDTFVVLMMENRSFDHYLGWLPGADGRQAGLTYADKTGRRTPPTA